MLTINSKQLKPLIKSIKTKGDPLLKSQKYFSSFFDNNKIADKNDLKIFNCSIDLTKKVFVTLNNALQLKENEILTSNISYKASLDDVSEELLINLSHEGLKISLQSKDKPSNNDEAILFSIKFDENFDFAKLKENISQGAKLNMDKFDSYELIEFTKSFKSDEIDNKKYYAVVGLMTIAYFVILGTLALSIPKIEIKNLPNNSIHTGIAVLITTLLHHIASKGLNSLKDSGVFSKIINSEVICYNRDHLIEAKTKPTRVIYETLPDKVRSHYEDKDPISLKPFEQKDEVVFVYNGEGPSKKPVYRLYETSTISTLRENARAENKVLKNPENSDLVLTIIPFNEVLSNFNLHYKTD